MESQEREQAKELEEVKNSRHTQINMEDYMISNKKTEEVQGDTAAQAQKRTATVATTSNTFEI